MFGTSISSPSIHRCSSPRSAPTALQVRQRGDPLLNPQAGGLVGEPRGTSVTTPPTSGALRTTSILASDVEPAPELSRADDERYTALPRTSSNRVRRLAHSWSLTRPRRSKKRAPSRTPTQGVHLRSRFALRQGERSARRLSLHSQRGHCEFYSTAMVVLLRELHVPSRNVTGFIGGTYNRFGHYYAVRQGDAHSWVEVYLADRGWQTFDPTPPPTPRPGASSRGSSPSCATS